MEREPEFLESAGRRGGVPVLGTRESKKVFVSGGRGSWPVCSEDALPPSALHLQLPGPD